MSDIEKPLSYLEWIRSIDTANIPNSKLFDKYNQYLIDWYKDKKKEDNKKIKKSKKLKNLKKHAFRVRNRFLCFQEK